MRPAYLASDDELLAACDASSSSTHSPGGQHRNKAEAAVRLRHRLSGLVAQCEGNRSRADNRAEALRRLRLRLAIATRGGSDPAWLEPFRSQRGLTVTPADDGYVRVVACCLDALAAANGGLAETANALGLSTSQLAKVLAADKEALHAANELRRALGQGPIRG